MILHITFSDGSNPWVFFSDNRHEIAKHWRRWMKNHPNTAMPEAGRNDWKCEPAPGGGFYKVYKIGDRWRTMNTYYHLGHALAALDRLGGVGE